jgi:hypothetical protein
VLTRGWQTAVRNLKEYLPSAKRWVVAFERPYHSRILRELIPHLGGCELLCLGEDSRIQVAKMGRRYRSDASWGFLEFAVSDGQVTHRGIDYRHALMEYSAWSAERIRLLFDVTDANFCLLFSEAPRVLKRRCQQMQRRLSRSEKLVFSDSGGSLVTLNCGTEGWQAYTGLRPEDYMLPSGEVACEPRSVDGELNVEGWIVGTIPFGTKYGKINRGDLKISFRGGEIVSVTGKQRSLCRDLEMVLERIPGMRHVAEVGVGQSKGVSRAAKNHEVACLWHERHFGLHLGLGATLSDAPGKRKTPHHLDLVLRRGRLADERGDVIIEW